MDSYLRNLLISLGIAAIFGYLFGLFANVL